jgi:hypothetical protein
MKTLSRIGFALVAVLALGLAAQAGEMGKEVTVKGSMSCAKCVMKQADATDCQDAIVAKGEDGAEVVYYLAKNEVAKEAGHKCRGAKAVMVTGKVKEKDGRKWITASKIEAATEG